MVIKIKNLPKWAQYLIIWLISYLISFIFTFFIWPFIFRSDISDIFSTFSLQIQNWKTLIYIFLSALPVSGIIFPIIWFFINLSGNKYKSDFDDDFLFYDEIKKKGSKTKFDSLFSKIDEKQEAGWVIKTSLLNKKNREIKYWTTTNSHAFILGDTRSGKTQKFIIPTIKYNIYLKNKDKRPNLMIIDPKGELFTSLSEEMKKQGYEIVLIDFQNLGKSRGINFLAPIWDIFHRPYQNESEKLENYDIASNWLQKVIESIHDWNAGPEKNSFWTTQAKNVVYTIGWYLLLYSNVDKNFLREKFVLANFIHFLSFDAFTKGSWIDVCKSTTDFMLKIFCQEKIIPLIKTNPETLTSILVNAYAGISKFNSVGLKMFSSKDETNFDELVQKSDWDFWQKFKGEIRPFVVFITFQLDSNIGQLMIPAIINNCYSSLITTANSKPNRRNYRSFLFLGDEFGNLPQIWQMATKMSTAASYGIYFGLVLQNVQQLEKYGQEKDTILSNSTLKIYFRSNDLKSLETFVKFAGKKEIIKKSHSNNQDPKKSGSLSTSLGQEDIITVSELAQMPPEESWIFITGLKPIHIKSEFAYKIWNDPERPLESFYTNNKNDFDFEFITFDFKKSKELAKKWSRESKFDKFFPGEDEKREKEDKEIKESKKEIFSKEKEIVLEDQGEILPKKSNKNFPEKEYSQLEQEILKLIKETKQAYLRAKQEKQPEIKRYLEDFIGKNRIKILNLYRQISDKNEIDFN